MRIILALGVMMLAHFVRGQGVAYSFDYLSTSNGLPSNFVHCIAQDSSGFIWIATNRGLVSFDGNELKTYHANPNDSNSLKENAVTNIFVSEDNKLWLGYLDSNFISRFEPVTKTFEHFDLKAQSRVSDFFMTGSRYLWFSNVKSGPTADINHLLGRFDMLTKKTDFFGPLPFSKYDESYGKYDLIKAKVNAIYGISPFSNADSLILTTPTGICIFDTEKENFHYLTPPLLSEKHEPGYYSVTGTAQYLRNKGLWIGTWESGLLNVDPKTRKETYYFRNGTIRSYRTKDRPLKNVISALHKINEEELLICYDHDLVIFNAVTHEFKDLPSLAPAESNGAVIVTQIFKDKQSNYWFVHDLGITKWRSNRNIFEFVKLPVKNPHNGAFSGDVYSVQYNPAFKEKYFGLNNADAFIVQSDNNSSTEVFSVIPSKDPDRNQSIRRILLDTDDLPLLVCHDDIMKYDRPRKLLKKWDLTGSNSLRFFYDAVFDSNHRLWVSSFTGIYVFEANGALHNYFSANDGSGLTSNTHFNCLIDRFNNIWFHAQDHLAIYDSKAKKFLEKQIKFDGQNQVKWINRFTTCGNDIYISTNSGLIKCEYNEQLELTFKPTPITSAVIKVVVTNDSTLFVQQEQSIIKFNPKTNTTQQYTHLNGLPRSITNVMQCQGQLYVGTWGGYYKYNDLKLKPKYFPIRVTSFTVLGKEVMYQNKVELNPQDNFFSIAFSAPNFTNPEEIEYSYRLEGLKDYWSPYSKKRTVDYTNIPGGNYIFHTRYININRKGQIIGESFLPIYIKTPFYKTWTFWILVGIFLATLVYASVMAYVSFLRKQHKIEKEHSRKIFELEGSALRSQINPHFIFNALNSINSFLVGHNIQQANIYLTKVAKLIRRTLENSNSPTVLLAEELEVLNMYIEIEQMRLSKFTCSFEIDADIDPGKVSIYPMIIQPYLENAIWHGISPLNGTGHISIQVTNENGHLATTITDNGVGRQPHVNHSQKKSLGHKITLERLNTLNALHNQKNTIHIFDLKDKNGNSEGTRVKIIFDTKL